MRIQRCSFVNIRERERLEKSFFELYLHDVIAEHHFPRGVIFYATEDTFFAYHTTTEHQSSLYLLFYCLRALRKYFQDIIFNVRKNCFKKTGLLDPSFDKPFSITPYISNSGTLLSHVLLIITLSDLIMMTYRWPGKYICAENICVPMFTDPAEISSFLILQALQRCL